MEDNWIRELYKRYLNGLEPWQIKLAMSRLKRYGVPRAAWEDAMQELAIIIVEFRFDPAKAGKASERTALCRRLDRRIKMMARQNGRQVAFHSRLAEMANPTEDLYTPDLAAADAEVRATVRELTPSQQEICKELASGRTVWQIARGTGHNWHTIQRQVAQIRQHFEERGFAL